MVCRVMVTWWLESCYKLHIIMHNTLAGVMLKCVWSHANMAHGVMLTWCVESSYSTLIKLSQLSYDRCHDLERVCNIYFKTFYKNPVFVFLVCLDH